MCIRPHRRERKAILGTQPTLGKQGMGGRGVSQAALESGRVGTGAAWARLWRREGRPQMSDTPVALSCRSQSPLADPHMAGGWDASPKGVWQKWGPAGVETAGCQPRRGASSHRPLQRSSLSWGSGGSWAPPPGEKPVSWGQGPIYTAGAVTRLLGGG